HVESMRHTVRTPPPVLHAALLSIASLGWGDCEAETTAWHAARVSIRPARANHTAARMYCPPWRLVSRERDAVLRTLDSIGGSIGCYAASTPFFSERIGGT